MFKFLTAVFLLLFIPILIRAADNCAPPAVHLDRAIPMTLGQLRTFNAAIRLKEMQLTEKNISPQEKSILKAAIKYLNEETEQIKARLSILFKAAQNSHWCGDVKSGGTAVNQYIRDLHKQVIDRSFQPMTENSYMKNVKEHFVNNGDKNVYGVFKGIYSGLKEAGLEVVNVTVDAQSVLLFGIFDPQAGEYYQFRSGLAKSIDTNGVEKTVKAIPRGVYDSVVTEGLSGDPEKTGKAYANFMMIVMGTEAAASQAVNTLSRVSKATNSVKLTVPTLDFVPTLDGSLTLAPAVAQVSVSPIVAATAAAGAGGGTTGAVCSVVAGTEMNSTPSGGNSPNISSKYYKEELPADLSPDGLKKLSEDLRAKINALPEEEFQAQLQGWLDDINTTVEGSNSRKGYTPGESPQTSVKTVAQLQEGMKAQYGKAQIKSAGEFTNLTGSAPMNIYGQIFMVTDPSMASMMLKMRPNSWSTFKDYSVGAAMLERMMRNFQSKQPK